MSNLYETIRLLCSFKDKSVSAMCDEIGISRGVMSALKSGRTQELSAPTLKKISDYLGIPVDDLLGTSPEREKKNRADGLKVALFGTDDVPDEMLEEVKRYAEYLLGKSRGYF